MTRRTAATPATAPTRSTSATPSTRPTRPSAPTAPTGPTPATGGTPATVTPLARANEAAAPRAPTAAADLAAPGTGDDIFRIALEHVGETYILGARAPMADPNWRGPWDCAEFASWCVFQATGVLYGVEPRQDAILADAFTGFWGDQALEDQAAIAVEDAARIVGACLLRLPASQRVGHIVISDGEGGTVEAHSSTTGVIRHRISNRRWDFGVLVPGVRYLMQDAPVAIEPPRFILRLTSPMTRGPRVAAVQEALIARGFSPGTADGVYGPQTESAVQAFQERHGLVPDGEVGEATWRALGLS